MTTQEVRSVGRSGCHAAEVGGPFPEPSVHCDAFQIADAFAKYLQLPTTFDDSFLHAGPATTKPMELHGAACRLCERGGSGLVEFGGSSVAGLALAPLQNAQSNEARMNVPGVAEGNWRWRCTEDLLDNASTFESLHELTASAGQSLKHTS
jgi:4-alpha-glucanotransferase